MTRKNLTRAPMTHTSHIPNLDQNRIRMPAFKGASFQDRQKSTAEAKKALLEKFKARPAADDPVVIEREAQRREIAAAREARVAGRDARLRAEADERARQEAEKQAALQARLKVDEEAREADSIVEAARLQLEAEAAIQTKALLEIEKRAERDARYAARKGRKAESKSERRRHR
ncbi:DUF6481 family protein [Rhodoblastus sp.]|uniref:DUF6481 family protein n=2 Tax=Rhodoblastus sp. TaxID=1962975 RepID=UPI003F99AEC7